MNAAIATKVINKEIRELNNENHPSIHWRHFLKKSWASEYTKQGYIRYIDAFMKYCHFTNPDSLVEQDSKLIQLKIVKFIDYLRNEKQASQRTLICHYSALKKFYETQEVYGLDFPIKWHVISEHIGASIPRYEDIAYTREEIVRLLEKANQRDRVLILLLAGSLRKGAVHLIKIKDLKPIDEHNIYQLTVYADSPNDKYITFTTPELRKEVDSYLAWRRQLGEIITGNSPLLRTNFNRRNLKTVREQVKPMTENSVKIVILQLIKDSGIREGKTKICGRYDTMGAHGLRKWAVTQMINSGAEFNARERLVGHKINGMDKHYDRGIYERMLGEFLKCIPNLTINEEERSKLIIEQLETESKKQQTVFTKALEEEKERHTDSITQLSDMMIKMQKRIDELEKK